MDTRKATPYPLSDHLYSIPNTTATSTGWNAKKLKKFLFLPEDVIAEDIHSLGCDINLHP